MAHIYENFGITSFFGTDDNFFNDHARALEILGELARTTVDGGTPLTRRIRWATEATVHDVLQMREHLYTARAAGLRAIWMGVEDLTAAFVKKGQTVDKTTEAFRLLIRRNIHPMPMMMHHDGQPLYTPGKPYGLLNQAQILRDAGAVTFQALMMTPSTGSKLYEEAFTKGVMYASVHGREIGPHMLDANYVVASEEPRPWRKQVNLLIAYVFFYNPLRFLKAIVFPKSRLYLADMLCQLLGMYGLLHTIRRTVPWIWRLWRGPIVRCTKPPVSRVPIRSPDGGRASHALHAQDDPQRAASAPARPDTADL
jgi:radical SAM superfamily enzyme YgiQ (UPF0313 family)